MEDWLNWRSNRNRLPKLQLLDGLRNVHKSDMPLIQYYNGMNVGQQNTFREQAMIPENSPLDIEHFGDFYRQRKEILANRLRALLG